ncbi:M20 family metallopeptidase [Cronobacter sakazakii]|uniref:M20 family metallopeptidase n=1 Tax=Cronobacter sakazakii TaxID=28141 RepID=UPI001558DC40|nr:M20/M25/M40 family metallo-hydrolase [Cronobacter sakazakii]NUW65486.1 M20/M25/M40 family metallo-hydrolase [Cronobacter sakazakii]
MTVQPHASLDATLELLSSLTAWQSVADQPDEQRSLAAWLEAWLIDALDAEVILPVAQQPTDSPPLVHVRVDIGAPDTLVLYNMYDVMPADAEGWQVDPFSGGIRHWADKGDVFISRGAENNKGPLAGMLTVVRDLWESGRLITNLEILLEGEEECGSGTLRRYLARTPCPVSPALAVLFPSLCEYGGGAPRLYLGFTGMTAGRLRVAGGDWGGPQAAIHASNAAWIANPAWRLVQALAAIAPAGRNGVLETLPLDDAALRILDELAPQFSIADELTMRKSQRLTITGDTREALAFLLGSVVLNLSEIRTTPLPGRGIIPPLACAEFALRTPPGSSPDILLDAMRASLSHQEIAGVEMVIDDSYPGRRFSADDAGVMELLNSYHQQQTRPQIWPWAPGCAPAYAFAPVAPAFLIGGLGYGGNAHGVNEFVTLRGLTRYTRSLRDWLLSF